MKKLCAVSHKMNRQTTQKYRFHIISVRSQIRSLTLLVSTISFMSDYAFHNIMIADYFTKKQLHLLTQACYQCVNAARFPRERAVANPCEPFIHCNLGMVRLSPVLLQCNLHQRQFIMSNPDSQGHVGIKREKGVTIFQMSRPPLIQSASFTPCDTNNPSFLLSPHIQGLMLQISKPQL